MRCEERSVAGVRSPIESPVRAGALAVERAVDAVAPSVEAAHKVSLITRAEGAVSAESWQALEYDAFLNLLEEVEP